VAIFQKMNFTSHSGLDLSWKIECDEISNKEWEESRKTTQELNDSIVAGDLPGGTMQILGSGTLKENVNQVRGALTPLMEDLKKLGPEGELAAQIGSGMLNIVDSFDTLSDSTSTTAERLQSVANIIGQIGAIQQASSKAKIAAIDKEIEAEKKRDGKSKDSLSKIAAMEKKKDALARKAFEDNKKMMIAGAIASTAAGVVGALGSKGAGGWGPWNIAMAAMVAAMGLKQVSIIRAQQYSGGSEGGSSTPQSISVGKRDNKVDVSKGVTAGELSYLRGNKGIGTNANNFTPTGGAAGLKSYSQGSFMVGEQGAEVVTTNAPTTITPNDRIGGQNLNANITINAVDAAGVAEVLEGQKGNIINMLQQAAHEHGEEFIEAVNPASYSGAEG